MAGEAVIALLAAEGDALVTTAEVDASLPRPGEVAVGVRAVSVNRGELHRLRTADPGWRPGWDFAGVVTGASAGFQPGDRVFGIAAQGGAWAEQVVVPADAVVLLPAQLTWEVAAALPVAGLTAYRTLRLAGVLSGQRVLIVGAGGGVGRFAVQLAALGGAEVTAVVGSAQRGTGLRDLGARHVSVGLDALPGHYDVVLESAGGRSLEKALHLVAEDGLVVTFGNSSQTPTQLPVSEFYAKQARLLGYHLLADLGTHRPADDLSHLAELVVAGRLNVDLAMVTTIDRIAAVLHELGERQLSGKAVLTVPAGA